MILSLKPIRIVLLLVLLYYNPLQGRDSTKSLYATAGSYVFGFNPGFYANVTPSTFFFNTISPLQNGSIGCKSNLYFTPKINAAVSLLYSYACIGYHYSSTNSPNFLNADGYIKMHGFFLNTIGQYKVLKWLKINFGFSHYVNITNRFDNSKIARNVGWYNKEDKSVMKPYAIALTYGLEFKLYKKLSLEINRMKGLSNFIVLNPLDNPNVIFPQKLGYTGLTLNYKIR